MMDDTKEEVEVLDDVSSSDCSGFDEDFADITNREHQIIAERQGGDVSSLADSTVKKVGNFADTEIPRQNEPIGKSEGETQDEEIKKAFDLRKNSNEQISDVMEGDSLYQSTVKHENRKDDFRLSGKEESEYVSTAEYIPLEEFRKSTKYTEEEFLFLMQDGMGDEEPVRRKLRVPKMPLDKIVDMMDKDPLPEKRAERERRRKTTADAIQKHRERDLIMMEIADDVCGYFTDEYLEDQSIEDVKKNILTEFSTPAAKTKLTKVVELLIRRSVFLESSAQRIAAIGFFKLLLDDSSDPVEKAMFCIIEELLDPEKYPDEYYDSIFKLKPVMILSQVETGVVTKIQNADSLSPIWRENILDLIDSEPVIEEPEPEPVLSTKIEGNEEEGEGEEKEEPLPPKIFELGHILINPYGKSGFGSEFIVNKDLSVEENLSEFLAVFADDPEEFLRIPRLQAPMFTNDEMCWMNPNNLAAYEFDLMRDIDAKTRSEERDARIRELIKPALKEALSITQRQKLIEELKTGPLNARNVGVNPAVMPELVENNPVVSIDILLKLMEGEDNVQEYLASITDMDMSVHSMEVVNRLTSSVKLPDEFLYKYVSNCIKTCEGMQDKFIQSRLVRLLCVFLQSLIRNQLFDFQILYIEILSFCITFSRIREAAALYRLMKQVEGEDSELREMLAGKLENHQSLSEEAARNFANKDKDVKP